MDFSLMEKMWFGDFDDADAEAKAAESLAASVAQLQGVVPCPAMVAQLISLTNNPDHQTSDIAKLISEDVALTSRILRIVNSAGFGLRRKCTSIEHAVVLLGPKVVRDTAIALSLMDLFDDSDGLADKLLEHSAVVAGLAQCLGSCSPRLRNADIYICGLLHDIGKLLMLQVDDDYADLLKIMPDGYDRLHVAERERYGYDHAVLAGHVLAEWNIPAPVPLVVGQHHQAARAFQNVDLTGALVAVVRLADRLSYDLPTMELTESDYLDVIAADPAAVHLDILREDFEEVWDRLYAISRTNREEIAA